MKEYVNEEGELHQVNGPARFNYNGGYEAWWYNGELHRYYGPAGFWGGEESYYIFDEEII